MPVEKEPINQEVKPEKENTEKLMTEEEYINLCVDYALNGGWVKENQKDLLINKYLKPIYIEAARVLEEVKPEIEKELSIPYVKSSKKELNFVITKLNTCLNATRRIGSTDPNNILRAIKDGTRTPLYWSRHVAEAMYEKVSEILAE